MLVALETEGVAHASYCFYVGTVNIANLSPDTADMYINSTAVAYDVISPNAGKKCFARENIIRVSNKIFKKFVFLMA